MSDPTPLTLTVAVTGASGSIFPKHLLDALERDERVGTINFIISDSGLRVMAEELGVSGRNEVVAKLLGRASNKIQQQNNTDIGANVASGTYMTDAMIVLPCSMGTLARIANGMAIHLIERAADVCLKERRPLILCVRERLSIAFTCATSSSPPKRARPSSPSSRRFTFTQSPPTRSRASSPTASWHTWACRSPARITGKWNNSKIGINGRAARQCVCLYCVSSRPRASARAEGPAVRHELATGLAAASTNS